MSAQDGCPTAHDEYEFRYITFVSDKKKVVKRYHIIWSDGSLTREPYHCLRRLPADKLSKLISMADRRGDTTSERATKGEQRKKYLAALRMSSVHETRAESVPDAAITNSTAIHSRSAKRRRGDAAIDDDDPALFNHPMLDDGICVVCGMDCPGSVCSTAGCVSFICLHCMREWEVVTYSCSRHGGPPLRLSHDVAVCGVPSSTVVKYHVISDDATLTQRLSAPDCECTPTVTCARVIIISFHSHAASTRERQRDFFVEKLAGVSNLTGGVVVILTCWMNPEAQLHALKDISFLFSAWRFVAFRHSDLILTNDRLHSTLSCACRAVRSNAYVAFSVLCTSVTGAVFFEKGRGPYQFVSNSIFCTCGKRLLSAKETHVIATGNDCIRLTYRSCTAKKRFRSAACTFPLTISTATV